MRVLLWLFLAAPLIELWFIIRVGSHIGGIATIALLVMAGIIGMSLLRRQSLHTLLRVDQRLQVGELPAQEIVEGFVLTLVGLLLVIPGFITDFLALPLLVPPLRRRLVQHILGSGYYQQRYSARTYGAGGTTQTPHGGDTIDGEYRREDDPRLP